MQDEQRAVEALSRLGLTEYEARCYVALTRVEHGTAKEVSRLSEVPRSRVYDTVERLHRRGLVDVQQSEPRRYRAVPGDVAFDKLRRTFDDTVDEAKEALGRVESAEATENEGAWAIASADHVDDRVAALLDDATDRVHLLVADESTLTGRTLNRLAAATDRGVDVLAEVPSADVRERVRTAVPDADVVLSSDLDETRDVADRWPGKLVLVDFHAVLASGVEQSDLPTVEEETALWTAGRDHGFAAWVRELLADRADAGGSD
jgi:sugar-specific transcriptional regulator TrmB